MISSTVFEFVVKTKFLLPTNYLHLQKLKNTEITIFSNKISLLNGCSFKSIWLAFWDALFSNSIEISPLKSK